MVRHREAKLILEDGTVIKGKSFGHEVSVAGEVVFNTAMTGYPESFTDPSYSGQILVLTYPLIGNYGVPPDVEELLMLKYFESDKIHISGLVVSDYSFECSHWNAVKSLSEWLTEHKIPAIFDVDTRALTKILREKGTMLGKLLIGNNIDFHDPNSRNMVSGVSTKTRIVYGSGDHKVMLVDCGVKYNIIRHLLKRNTTVIRVPWDHNFLHEDFDGLFISNGPGDPKMCDRTINNIAGILSRVKPVFGICLGNQLLSLAAGGDTYKLKYGHRSHNQPVMQTGTNRCFITSQNHGFATDSHSLGNEWEPMFVNANDGTNEGIRHKARPFFSAQFHPEASSGPTDTDFLFDRFIDMIKLYK
ncbi:MAG: glutamine-hydrolyzing carbamoyl-phosphate synthase small subunit [Bacteroidales bacterium]|nr:glutamine-hydrolyzing carbamoyl-phosphate synthase small subunit [Bacteroidales bacterium]